MSESRESVKTIFGKALEIQSDEQRAKYLDEACAGDEALRAEVGELLGAIERAGNFLGGSSPADATIEQPITEKPITEKPGTVIGPYKLLQKIGEGGFGVVYMADQTEPVKRRVALKIIKPGMDSRQVIARFEAERQALAMMDHPNIARVLDAGTTDSGRPYFVMDLVKGVPITQFCDEHHLTPRERLELFVPVCQAIQHAHQKGVIHRDIKPSNVLVTEYDDRAVPKVIDFGVAKATEQRLTEKTMFTQLGQIVGTVDYMSPEQAKLNELDIDTRSDIYSLGVLLYELLTGETPFDRQRLRSAAFDELLRIIREEEPPRPSLRLSTSESLPSIAANRHTEPKKLSTLVRGELDWIVMKALEKDRARRYETATGFANDIQRYLNDEPVVACPPSVGYRFRKFARRNKAALLTAVVVTVALLLGITGTTWQAIQATRSLRRAVEAERTARIEADRANREFGRANQEADNARTEKAAAEAQRLRAESNLTLALDALNDFYLKAIGRDRLLGGKGTTLSSVEKTLIEAGLDFYTRIASQNEESTAATFQTASAFQQIGWLQGSLRDQEATHTALLEAITRFKKLTESFPNNARYFDHLGMAYQQNGELTRGWPKAEDTFAEAVDAYDKVIKLTPDDALAWARRGKAYTFLGAYDKAITNLDEAIRLNPTGHKAYESRALVHFNLKDYEKAIADCNEANRLAPIPAQRSYGLLEAAYLGWNNCDLAIANANEMIRLDPKGPWAYETRAKAYTKLGDFERAIADFGEAIRLNPRKVWTYATRAQTYAKQGEFERAIADWDQVITLRPDPWSARVNREIVSLESGDVERYRRVCRELLREYADTDDANVALNIADLCKQAPDAVEDWSLPIQLAEKALELRPNLGIPNALGGLLYRAGRYEDAAGRLQQSMELFSGGEGNCWHWYWLAMTCQQLGHSDEARKWLEKAEAQYEQQRTNLKLYRLRREARQVVGTHESVGENRNSEDSAAPETVNQAAAEEQ